MASAEEMQQLLLLQAQLHNMTAQAQLLQQQSLDAVALSAKILRLTCGVFVFFMQLGFSLIEAGTVRYKNTRNIMIKNVLDTCISAIAFWIFGYAIAFGYGSPLLGWKYIDGTVAYAGGQSQVEFFFAFVFCATSATIFAGAVAERTHLAAYLFFNFFLAALIYPVVAHMIWANAGFMSATPTRTFLGTNGVIDNAGSMVVHVTGGVTSLVGAWMVGPRLGRFDIEGKVVPFRGHSLVFIAFGTITLWVGFFGFNGGSVDYQGQNFLAWIQDVGQVCCNTLLTAASAGCAVWLCTYRRKDPTPEDTFNGVIGGLVAACATSSVVEPYAAVCIGIVAGVVYLVGVWVTYKFHIDDPLQATAVHLGCGSWGGIAVGFFATPWSSKVVFNLNGEPLSCGLFYGCSANQLAVQLLGLLVVYVWVGTTSFVLFWILNFFNLLRVKRQQEEVGLDVAFHGGDRTDDTDPDLGLGKKPLSQFRWHTSVWNKLRKGIGATARLCGRPSFLDASDGSGKGGLRFPKRDVWYRALDSTPFGQFSLAMYEANYIMEDTVEVEGSASGVFIGVHDGHNGCETAEFLRETLYDFLRKEFLKNGGAVSAKSLADGFLSAERQFTNLVRDDFEESPHLATVGACSAVAILTPTTLWVANCGDCRAVLGQVRLVGNEVESRAVQLTVDHNLSFPAIRDKFREEHPDMPDAVTEKNGRFRVKGKVMVTKAFGDLYLKSSEFNREPLPSRFRVPEPFNPPLLSEDPQVTSRVLEPHDAFVIMASDGLFEFVSNSEAVDIVASSPRKDIAQRLIKAALQKAAERSEIPYKELLRVPSGQRRTYHDDITVVVFFIDHASLKRVSRSSIWNKTVSVKGGISINGSGRDMLDGSQHKPEQNGTENDSREVELMPQEGSEVS